MLYSKKFVMSKYERARLARLSLKPRRVSPRPDWGAYRGENDRPDSRRGLGQLRVEG